MSSALRGCSLFCFYIKPQLVESDRHFAIVVPYSVSTSNHNMMVLHQKRSLVVPYSVSTSNHNDPYCDIHSDKVVPYSVSTSNHNVGYLMRLFP